MVAFEVDSRANKIEIRKAVETQFKGAKVADDPHHAGARQGAAAGQVRRPPF